MLYIREVTDNKEKGYVCSTILRSLPEWFTAEMVERYSKEVRETPVYAAFNEREEAVGIIAIKRQLPDCGDISVLGVIKSYQRNGAGMNLVKLAVDYCRARKLKYVTCRSYEDAPGQAVYAESQRFLKKMGFTPVCVIHSFTPPMMVYIKTLDAQE